MSLRSYIVTMFVATIAAFGALLFVMREINPTSAGMLGFFFFYGALFLSLFGLFALVGLIIRNIFRKNELVFRHVTTAFRQAAWYAAIVVGMLWLRSQGLLTWWNAALLVLGLTLFEFVALSLRRQPPVS
ncbi:hypothetical protein HY624_01865 [Candidatus Uhrbacteria bacterium]|nr:hypothetical protein [Candidatus Uhrbacteria bacterium]